MKKFTKNLIFVAIFIIAGTIYFFYDIRKAEKISNTLKKEYATIRYEESLDGRITKIYIPDPKTSRNNPHKVYLILDNSIKKDIYASFELTKKLTIDSVIEVGDQLIKEANSYKFCIYKVIASDTLKYEFELCDDLGYPLKNNKNK